MNKTTSALDQLRDKLLQEPEMILQDRDLMKVLVTANDQANGQNVIDLRSIAMERLEERFDRLEDTHQSVIAAAYENLSGTKQIQRAVLALLEPLDFTEFLRSLGGEVADILKVDAIKLCLESPASDLSAQKHLIDEYGDSLGFYRPGAIEEYLTEGRNMSSRAVTLRQIARASDTLYGEKAAWIRSEALMRLDLGAGNLPGLLALGSEDPHQFHPNQGSDLLAFLGAVFERAMRRWLG
ncbi:MAG: DUF484 family protein [Alphaproteobacteria bacterium]|nr:DUF484 family protein [Alphaproteobacteria bacterium]